MIFRTFTLTIHGPDDDPPDRLSLMRAHLLAHEGKAVTRILAGRVLQDVEDVVNDALPEGWSARIEEWDA